MKDMDRKILSALLDDSDKSAKELAKRFHIHPNTMLSRLRKLKKSGIIRKYTAQLDYVSLGYDFQVMILLRLKEGGTADFAQLGEILEMKELEALYSTTGDWNLLTIWRMKDKQHMNEILAKLSGCPAISGALSQLVLCTYKDPHEFNPLG